MDNAKDTARAGFYVGVFNGPRATGRARAKRAGRSGIGDINVAVCVSEDGGEAMARPGVLQKMKLQRSLKLKHVMASRDARRARTLPP